MSASPAQAPVAPPAGNIFDKYGSANPLVRRLMRSFQAALSELFELAAPASVLDVGCGEGILTGAWAQALAPRRVVGVDLDDDRLKAEWARRSRPNLQFAVAEAQALPFDDEEFDLVAAVESLEHVPGPQRMLAEMTRVARRHLLVSVPREPLWRALNIIRGAHLRSAGNTPGHVNHWSASEVRDLLEGYGEVVQLRTPLPWTMALVRVTP